jgi:hypothetical protein
MVHSVEMVDPLRGRAQWEVVRSLGVLPSEDIKVVLLGLQLVVTTVSC